MNSTSETHDGPAWWRGCGQRASGIIPGGKRRLVEQGVFVVRASFSAKSARDCSARRRTPIAMFTASEREMRFPLKAFWACDAGGGSGTGMSDKTFCCGGAGMGPPAITCPRGGVPTGGASCQSSRRPTCPTTQYSLAGSIQPNDYADLASFWGWTSRTTLAAKRLTAGRLTSASPTWMIWVGLPVRMSHLSRAME